MSARYRVLLVIFKRAQLWLTLEDYLFHSAGKRKQTKQTNIIKQKASEKGPDPIHYKSIKQYMPFAMWLHLGQCEEKYCFI